MKKRIIVIISAFLLNISGCSSPQVDVIINVDGYEGILLATEKTVIPPVSVPVFTGSDISSQTVSGETGSEPEGSTEADQNTDASQTVPSKPIQIPVDDPVTAAPVTEPEPVIVTEPEKTAASTINTEATDPEPVTTDASSAETKPAATTEEEPPVTDLTPIMGQSVATADQMRAFIKAVNPDVDQKIIDMIPYYLSEGATEGVRGDIAFAQSCVETGYFKFEKMGTGSAVTIDDNNFCGLGVTTLGEKGCIFETPQLGIRAQIQHLKAYGSTLPLNGEQIDPRFHYVVRGCAKYWEWLGMQENPEGRGWAGGKNYGPIILDIFYNVLEY